VFIHRSLVIIIGSLHLRRPVVTVPYLFLRVDSGVNGIRPGSEFVCKRSEVVEVTADNVAERDQRLDRIVRRRRDGRFMRRGRLPRGPTRFAGERGSGSGSGPAGSGSRSCGTPCGSCGPGARSTGRRRTHGSGYTSNTTTRSSSRFCLGQIKAIVSTRSACRSVAVFRSYGAGSPRWAWARGCPPSVQAVGQRNATAGAQLAHVGGKRFVMIK
jgi:hypothetical protein